jgi:hypothetical protein
MCKLREGARNSRTGTFVVYDMACIRRNAAPGDDATDLCGIDVLLGTIKNSQDAPRSRGNVLLYDREKERGRERERERERKRERERERERERTHNS